MFKGLGGLIKKLGPGIIAWVGIPLLWDKWFGQAQSIEQDTLEIPNLLTSLKVTGPGKLVVDNIKKDVTKLQIALSILSKEKTSENLQSYVDRMTAAHESLTRNFKSWADVERFAEDQTNLDTAYAKIEEILMKSENMLNNMAVDITKEMKKQKTTELEEPVPPTIDSDDLSKLQRFIGRNLDPSVGETGVLDKETVKYLKNLEFSLTMAGSKPIELVRPPHYVIPFNAFLEIIQALK